MHGKSLVSNKWTPLERKAGISHKCANCRNLTAGIFYKTAKHKVPSRSVWALSGHSNMLTWVISGHSHMLMWVTSGYSHMLTWVMSGHSHILTRVMSGHSHTLTWVMSGNFHMLTWVMNGHSHTLMWVESGYSHMLTFSTLPIASFWSRSEHCKITNHSEIQDEQAAQQSLHGAPDVNTIYCCWWAEFAILHNGILCDY